MQINKTATKQKYRTTEQKNTKTANTNTYIKQNNFGGTKSKSQQRLKKSNQFEYVFYHFFFVLKDCCLS